jgi:hypothetical protein
MDVGEASCVVVLHEIKAPGVVCKATNLDWRCVQVMKQALLVEISRGASPARRLRAMNFFHVSDG